MSAHAPVSPVALVAGATGILGRRIVEVFQDAGIRVAVQYRGNRAVADELVMRNHTSMSVRCELTDPRSIDEMFTTIESKLGLVSIVVNAAHPSGLDAGPVSMADSSVFEHHLDGLRAHHLICSRAIPGMRAQRWGRIVYISGASTARPVSGFGAFAVAKSAATTLTKYMAVEEARHGITANVIAPGRIEVPAQVLDERLTAEAQRLLARTVLGRLDTADDIAAMTKALVDPGLASFTGQTVWMAGGEIIG